MKYKALVDGQWEWEVDTEQDLDSLEMPGGSIHLIWNRESVTGQILEADLPNKKFVISVDGEKYEVKLKDPYDQLVDQLGLTKVSLQVEKYVKAPMPGLVVEILVEEGQQVEKGESLLILEAMKMENILKSHGAGTVKSISVEKGMAVEKGQVLIEMDEI